MTRTRIRNLIRKKLMETTASFWTDVELNDWINDAGHDVAFKTKCIQTDGKFAAAESTSEYVLTDYFSGLISVTRAYFYQNGATWTELDPTSIDKLNKLHPGWKNADDGVPSEYYFDFERSKTLGLYVSPNSTNAGSEYIELYYGNDYTDISSDDDSPDSIPELLQQGMVEYVVATGLETRGYRDKANDAWMKYEARLRTYHAAKDGIIHEDDDVIMKPAQNI